MKFAKVGSHAFRGLPALRMLALIDSHHVRLVLSEVERLAWVDLMANCIVKVHVIDHAVAVGIEHFEDVRKLVVR